MRAQPRKGFVSGRLPGRIFLGHEGVDLGYRLIGSGCRVVHTPRVSTTHHAAIEHRPDWRVYYYYTRNGIWVAYQIFPAADGDFTGARLSGHDGIFFVARNAGCGVSAGMRRRGARVVADGPPQSRCRFTKARARDPVGTGAIIGKNPAAAPRENSVTFAESVSGASQILSPSSGTRMIAN